MVWVFFAKILVGLAPLCGFSLIWVFFVKILVGISLLPGFSLILYENPSWVFSASSF